MHEAKRAILDDLVSTNCVRTGHELKNTFLTKAFFITLDTHVQNIRLKTDVTAEILKIKNCGVENLFKYIYMYNVLEKSKKISMSKLRGDKIEYSTSLSTLSKVLKGLGLSYKRCVQTRKILVVSYVI